MPKTEAELDRMIERVRNREGGVMAEKTQGERILDDFCPVESKGEYFQNLPMSQVQTHASIYQVEALCALATEAELNRKANERAANALERIADELEKPRDVINTLENED